MAKTARRGASEATHRATARYGKGNSTAQRGFATRGVRGTRALVAPSRALNLRVSPGEYSTTHPQSDPCSTSQVVYPSLRSGHYCHISDSDSENQATLKKQCSKTEASYSELLS